MLTFVILYLLGVSYQIAILDLTVMFVVFMLIGVMVIGDLSIAADYIKEDKAYLHPLITTRRLSARKGFIDLCQTFIVGGWWILFIGLIRLGIHLWNVRKILRNHPIDNQKRI